MPAREGGDARTTHRIHPSGMISSRPPASPSESFPSRDRRDPDLQSHQGPPPQRHHGNARPRLDDDLPPLHHSARGPGSRPRRGSSQPGRDFSRRLDHPPHEDRRDYPPDPRFDRPHRPRLPQHPKRPNERHLDTAPEHPRRPASPSSSSKRPRSPGLPFADQDPTSKRPRHGRSPDRAAQPQRAEPRQPLGPEPRAGDYSPPHFSPHRRRSVSPDRGRELDRREKRKKRKKKNKNRRASSRSPLGERDYGGGPPPAGRQHIPHPRQGSRENFRSRSPHPPDRGRSFSRGRSPISSQRRGRPPTSSSFEGQSRDRGATPDRDFDGAPPQRRRQQPNEAPSPPRERSRGRKRGRGRDERPSRKQPPLASGANSIEVNMSSRGGFRGGYGPGGGYHAAGPGQYGQGPPSGPRRFSHSSGNATPHSSFHGSPPPQSPYGGSQGWGNQQRYQSPSQYPQYPQGGGYPNGPHGQYPPPHSPAYGPPSGPSPHYNYPQGPARGGYRGGSNFRGNSFNHVGRAGYRGNSFRAAPSNGSIHAGSGHSSPAALSQNNDVVPQLEQVDMPSEGPHQEDDNPFRPSKDLQVEDTSKPVESSQDQHQEPQEQQHSEGTADEQPPPTPTGPQNPKIKFQFKTFSKAPATIPKPEISSKFNAIPQQPRTQQQQQQQRHDTIRTDRNLPNNVPTEPAAARPRHDRGQRPADNPRQPPHPRVRMVKKTMRRLIKKEGLASEMATSESVYYRKPGNESVVGSGTYGKVFKGINVYTKNMVALKRIRMEGERDGFPVTAVREIKLLQSLKHLNIVQLQEVMVEKNDCFMVFEYMAHDLTGLLNHPSFKLDAAQKKHLARQLFEGLNYLHHRGVLHRDIKAANILVSSDGVLKLADFGLARFYAKRRQLDYTNRVITIWYRSPELLLGETRYGPAVDIWSAACVMVEILTRAAIFPGEGGEISQLDKIWAILGTPNKMEWPGLLDMPWFELLRPSFRRPNNFAKLYGGRLTPAAFELLEAMFRFDPAKRPSAAEVLEHAYFVEEEPTPRQAIELASIEGDWHEFESKQLRKKNEQKEKEARRAAREKEKEAGGLAAVDKKRPHEPTGAPDPLARDPKRQNVDGRPPSRQTEMRNAPTADATRVDAGAKVSG